MTGARARMSYQMNIHKVASRRRRPISERDMTFKTENPGPKSGALHCIRARQPNSQSDTPKPQEKQATRVFISRCGLHFEHKGRRGFARLFFIEPCDTSDMTPYWYGDAFDSYAAAMRYCESRCFSVDLEMSRGAQS
jgi:hypothetical protein